MRLFHIARRADWDATEGGAHRPPRFAEEGFVHLATEEQVPGVLERWFAGEADLVLVEVDAAGEPELRWEPGARGEPGPFPHLYAPLPLARVVAVTPLADERSTPGGRAAPG